MPQLTSKSQVTIPKPIRERLGVSPGESVEFIVVDDHVEVRSTKRPSAFAVWKAVFNGQASGRSDTSTRRKELLREHIVQKHRTRR